MSGDSAVDIHETVGAVYRSESRRIPRIRKGTVEIRPIRELPALPAD
jgi:hypothetical protein